MRRHLPVVLVAAALALGGCKNSFLFEEENPDPHAPTLSALRIENSQIGPFDTLKGSVAYFDAGADIETIKFRLRDAKAVGTLLPELPPPEGEKDAIPLKYFPGTSGTAEFNFDASGVPQLGPQRIEVWAEDSKGSRSSKLEFTVTLSF